MTAFKRLITDIREILWKLDLCQHTLHKSIFTDPGHLGFLQVNRGDLTCRERTLSHRLNGIRKLIGSIRAKGKCSRCCECLILNSRKLFIAKDNIFKLFTVVKHLCRYHMSILTGDHRNLCFCDRLASTESGCSNFLDCRLHGSDRFIRQLRTSTKSRSAKIVNIGKINSF